MQAKRDFLNSNRQYDFEKMKEDLDELKETCHLLTLKKQRLHSEKTNLNDQFWKQKYQIEKLKLRKHEIITGSNPNLEVKD